MLMMKSLAQEVAPYRIRVNSICPGAIRTPINMEAWGTRGSLSRAAEADSLQAHRRGGGDRPRRGVARVRLRRLRAWHQPVRRRRHDPVSRFRDGRMMPAARSLRPGAALRGHWPEYLIEAWALGMFMISAGIFATLLGSSRLAACTQRIHEWRIVRRALIGIAMGLTAVALIYSPWGKRSGAHMNPAVTLTFWRLGILCSVRIDFTRPVISMPFCHHNCAPFAKMTAGPSSRCRAPF